MIQSAISPCECGNLEIKARSMCGRCYQRWRVKNRKPHRRLQCKSDHCDRQPLARGYCVACYSQFTRNGKTKETNYGTTSCTVDGCDNPHRARGFCYSHYNKAAILWKRGHTWHEARDEISPKDESNGSRLKLIKERVKLRNAKKARKEKRLDHYARSMSRDTHSWGDEEADHHTAERSAVEGQPSFEEQDYLL